MVKYIKLVCIKLIKFDTKFYNYQKLKLIIYKIGRYVKETNDFTIKNLWFFKEIVEILVVKVE